ncbi:FMN-binding protein [Actinomyces timonensis]|uniref:FMN-binding protein n=1 Tax=Actinomyces timonensis TaxID=1288391 RepID=A0AAU8N0C5_9ACTO
MTARARGDDGGGAGARGRGADATRRALSLTGAAMAALSLAACGGSDTAPGQGEYAGRAQGTGRGPTPWTGAPASASAPPASPTAGPYTDGSYQDTQAYKGADELPADESIDVSVTLSDGAITDVTVTGRAGNATSEDFIRGFTSRIKGAVVGKSIEQAHVTALAGASKTSAAFNAAIDAIAEQARG